MSENHPRRFLGVIPRSLMETLGIELTEVSADRVVARMPIGPSVHNPFGRLHGGASVALAETVASIGGITTAPDGHIAVGLEINANHLRPMREGTLYATATPLHRGRRTQVWRVELRDDHGQRICESRCTVAIVPDPSVEPAPARERGES